MARTGSDGAWSKVIHGLKEHGLVAQPAQINGTKRKGLVDRLVKELL